MNQMAPRDEKAAPTLRSAELAVALGGREAPPPSPRLRFRLAPAIAVVDAPPAWPSLDQLTGGGSAETLSSAVAREIVTTLIDAVVTAARDRLGWS